MSALLTDREADLMQILWERGPSTVAEIHERLRDDLAYTTVLALMRTLEAKGVVRRTKEGRAHRYAPLVAQMQAQRAALRSVAGRFFRGSIESLLLHFVSHEKLTPAAVERIKAQLERKGKT
ncbi:MAG TPA: BlaI/MecI/CopY family transcriptional regulator [Steroidobacteraceae bacterium]